MVSAWLASVSWIRFTDMVQARKAVLSSHLYTHFLLPTVIHLYTPSLHAYCIR